MTTLQTLSLDGRRFEGVVLEPGKTTGDAERISFRDGQFHSSACEPYGYGDGRYQARQDGDAVVFEVQTDSPQYGQLRWACRIAGDKLDGTLTMLRDGAAVNRKWVVAGEERAAQPPTR